MEDVDVGLCQECELLNLINETSKWLIQASKGLRQGDPLSPFLFLLVVDVLSQLILKGVEGNITEPFRVE